jgi:hypothetical protein
MFVISRVPFGTRQPPMVQSSKDSCGANNGAGGYKHNVSFTMAWRKTNLPIFDLFTVLSLPTWKSSSS